MRIAVKEVGKELKIVETEQKYRSASTRRYIGVGTITEFVPLNKECTLCIGVNEDGLRLDLPTNFLLQMNSPYWPIQKMVGTVVFVRHKDVNPYEKEIWDFEVEDLRDSDLKLIEKILSDENQDMLKKNFKDYGKGCAVITSLTTGERMIF